MRTEVDPSARVQVRGLGSLLAPANCAMCGNGTREQYVDPAIFYDWEGQIYFCTVCVTEMAETIGCLPPEQSDFLKSVNEKLAARNAELEEVAAKYEKLVSVLRSVGVDSISVSTPSVSSDGAAKVVDADKREHKIASDEPTIDRAAEGAKSAQSIASRGRNDSARSTGSNESATPSKSGLNI